MVLIWNFFGVINVTVSSQESVCAMKEKKLNMHLFSLKPPCLENQNLFFESYKPVSAHHHFHM